MTGDSFSKRAPGDRRPALPALEHDLEFVSVRRRFADNPAHHHQLRPTARLLQGDTYWTLAPFASALLPGGGSVELGLPFDTARNTPCAPPAGQGLVAADGTLNNLACNGYFGYNRTTKSALRCPRTN